MKKYPFSKDRYSFIKLQPTEALKKLHLTNYSMFTRWAARIEKDPTNEVAQHQWMKYKRLLDALEADILKTNEQTMRNDNPLRILVKLASRNRPYKCISTLNNILEHTQYKENLHILLSLDEDDESMKTHLITKKLNIIESKGLLTVVYRKTSSKIHAFNRDINEYLFEWDVLISSSDDIEIIKSGYDNTIRNIFKEQAPDLDLCLHLKEEFDNDCQITMPVMGRTYYNRTNYVFSPLYHSLFCDNDLLQTSKILGKYYLYNKEILFRHNHPNNFPNTVNRDFQYIHTESFYNQDEKVFKERQLRNFDIVENN